MNADDVLWAELRENGIDNVKDLHPEQIVDLGLRYSVWLPVETYIASPWLAPFAIRKIRIRSDPRVPGPPRDLWGFPDETGHFSDDNSMIKAMVRSQHVVGRASPYGEGKLGTGLVCCHVWPRTTSQRLLFSFVPNLVWLPKSLAAFSDAHFINQEVHRLHHVLRAAATERYASVRTSAGESDVERAWSIVGAEPVPTYGASELNEVRDGSRISVASRRRTQRFVAFLDALAADNPPERRFSRRYHAGRGRRIDPSVPAVHHAVASRDLVTLNEQLKRTL